MTDKQIITKAQMIMRIAELSANLKRKEQECEELKGCLFQVQNATISLTKQLDQFKKANEEKNELLAKLGCPTIATARMKAFTLEQQLEAYKMEAEEGKEINAELKAENSKLKYKAEFFENYNNAHINKITKLEKTLTEIKEIAEGCQYGGCHECKYQPRTDCRTELIAHILQKISEVENTVNDKQTD